MMRSFTVLLLSLQLMLVEWPACLPGNGAALGQHVTSLSHGWDCVACANNSMLAGNFGTNRPDFNLSNPWWVEVVASHYAVVSLNSWLGSKDYNGTGEEARITIARALKAANPKIKTLYYQAADRVSTSPYVTRILDSHPEWWLKDDKGQVIWFHNDKTKTHPVIDLTVPRAQTWFANLSLSYFSSQDEARELCDGIFVDAAAYAGGGYKDFSAERFDQLFKGRMQAMQMAQNLFTDLNKGEVWGNPDPPIWEKMPTWYHGAPWNLTMQYFNGGFDPWFGSFAVINKDGDWNVTLMERTFDYLIAASNAGHSIIVHAFPGPATAPFTSRGTARNDFRVNSWRGNETVPTDPEACREAAARLLVQSLAPFLIVASERTFFSYSGFWNIEDGYIPCPEHVECGMPSTWYPEFSKPLGPPLAPASRNGTVWTRKFGHASVYVDLANRRSSRIDWL